MSATTAISPVEFVKGLSDEEKEAVLMTIVGEVLALYPNSGAIPLYAADGNVVAFLQTLAGAQAMFDRHGPKLTPEERAEISERARDPGPLLTVEEMLARLAARGQRRDRESPLLATG